MKKMAGIIITTAAGILTAACLMPLLTKPIAASDAEIIGTDTLQSEQIDEVMEREERLSKEVTEDIITDISPRATAKKLDREYTGAPETVIRTREKHAEIQTTGESSADYIVESIRYEGDRAVVIIKDKNAVPEDETENELPKERGDEVSYWRFKVALKEPVSEVMLERV